MTTIQLTCRADPLEADLRARIATLTAERDALAEELRQRPHSNRNDLIGRKFGHATVIGPGENYWRKTFRCDCARTFTRAISRYSHRTFQCGQCGLGHQLRAWEAWEEEVIRQFTILPRTYAKNNGKWQLCSAKLNRTPLACRMKAYDLRMKDARK